MNFPPGDTLFDYSSISFTTKNIGWIRTSGSIDANHRLTKIFKTSDGGHNWVRQYIDNTSGGWIIFVVDSLHCWINGNAGNLLIYTTNGGDKWDSTDVSSYNLSSIYFFDEKKGIALSEVRPWFTTDGGKSWNAGDSIHVKIGVLDFVDGNRGWIISGTCDSHRTDTGSISYTIDGGKTWMYKDSTAAVMLGIEFADSLVGYAVGRSGVGSSGYIYSTINGGNEWTRKQLLSSGPMIDVGFLNRSNRVDNRNIRENMADNRRR